MIGKIRSYFPLVILVETMIILLLCWILWGSHKADHSVPLASQDSTISKVTVTVYVPLKGLDKAEAKKKGVISKDVEKNPDSAVLASGHIKDDSGSRDLAAVLNVQTGDTVIVEKRSFMESMKRFEVGIGYGFESGDEAKVVQLRTTVGRIDRIYFTGQAQLFEVDRIENRHPWNVIALINIRF